MRSMLGAFRLVALVGAAWIWSHGIALPLNDQHAFRQSQTMLDVQRMELGGPLLLYETPVLGPPWALPLEFPTYQWAVLLTHQISGASLDLCGRLVSLAAFLLLLAIGPSVLSAWGASRSAGWCWQVLMLSSGTYLFWSRTTLIESTALLLTVSALGAMRGVVDGGSRRTALAAIVCTGLALATKPTTSLPPLVFVTCLMAPRLYRKERGAWMWVGCFGLSALGFFAWTAAAALARNANVYGAATSAWAWNVGTLDQKMSWPQWQRYLQRTLNDGAPYVLRTWAWVPLLALLLAPSKRLLLALLVLFFLPPLIFTNLHFVHNYYPFACLIFLLACVGAAYGALVDDPRLGMRLFGICALVLTSVISVRSFTRSYAWERMNRPAEDLMFARTIAAHTAPNDLLVVFGDDWTSYYHYYAERRGLAVPDWAESDLAGLQSALARLEGSGDVGAVLLCKHKRAAAEWVRTLWPTFRRFSLVASDATCDTYLAASAPVPR